MTDCYNWSQEAAYHRPPIRYLNGLAERPDDVPPSARELQGAWNPPTESEELSPRRSRTSRARDGRGAPGFAAVRRSLLHSLNGDHPLEGSNPMPGGVHSISARAEQRSEGESGNSSEFER